MGETERSGDTTIDFDDSLQTQSEGCATDVTRQFAFVVTPVNFLLSSAMTSATSSPIWTVS